MRQSLYSGCKAKKQVKNKLEFSYIIWYRYPTYMNTFSNVKGHKLWFAKNVFRFSAKNLFSISYFILPKHIC